MCEPSHGKYQDCLTFMCHEVIMNGFGDEFIGNSDSSDGAELVRFVDEGLEPHSEYVHEARAYGYCDLHIGEACERSKHIAGSIVFWDSQGFIESDEYETESALTEAWNKVELAYLEPSDDDAFIQDVKGMDNDQS